MKSIAFGLLLFVATSLPAAEDAAPFSLAIVPTGRGLEGGEITTAKNQPREFYVVLHNLSSQPQPVWETWCSWGFWTISFEFTMADGKHISVTKNRHEGFTKNFPATFFIPPGEVQVYPIQLDKEWDNRPTFFEAGGTPVAVQAIYQVAPTPESTKLGVWTGRIESAKYNFILNHW